jgi:death-on-curing protein
MIEYLEESDLKVIFSFVSERYGRQEEVPEYELHREGIQKLVGVLERTRMDAYYPSLLEKAAYLLIAINKGHFFSNGNKRLALVAMTAFLTLNNKNLKYVSKDSYRELLSRLFPEYTSETDFAEFMGTDFATYNLSIIIADSAAYSIDHESLKGRVLAFLTEAVVEYKD